MSGFDLIFTVVLSLFIFTGIWKGFFREVLGLAGVFAGAFFALVGFGPLSKILHQAIPEIPAAVWIFLSFLIIFVAVYLISRLLATLLGRISKLMLLGWLNRLLGGIVGGLKGAIFISLFLLLIGFLPFQESLQNIRKDSLMYQPLQRFVPLIYNVFTDFSFSSLSLERKLTDLVQDLQGKLNEKMIEYFFYQNK